MLPGGRPNGFNLARTPGGNTVVYGDVDSTLSLAQAKNYTDRVLAALGHPPGVEHVYVTGAAAIQHDLDPVFNRDLRHGELEIALPIALLVLLAVFGFSWAVTIPLIFAACTITGTLGIVYGVASIWATPTYATNLVELIGLGIAVDYSLLIVYRFREELAAGLDVDDAVARTMQTAGRAVVFSGIAVALGLALLVAMPLPFIRMLGVAGFLIPIVSILARRDAATRRSSPTTAGAAPRGTGCCPAGGQRRATAFWPRLARSIMARPRLYLAGGSAVLIAMALPALRLQVTPGSTLRDPAHVAVGPGLRPAARRRSGPGRSSPAQILRRQQCRLGARRADAGGARAGSLGELDHDPEVAKVYTGRNGPTSSTRRAATSSPRRRPPRLRLPAGAGVRPAAARAR